MIKVAIIEDHSVLVDAFSIVLEEEADLGYVGSAGTIEAGRDLLTRTTPDVVLLDISLPDGDGIEALSDYKQLGPQAHFVILTSYSDERNLMRALESGAAGFVSKSSPLSSALNSIRQAAEGEIVVPASLLSGLLVRVPRNQTVVNQRSRSWERLTPREEEVLTCLARGQSGKMIASELHISPLTVRTHIRNLMEKLGVHSRLEAVSFGLRYGLIDPP